MGRVTADEEREHRRARYVKSSSRRIWRITAVACAAILGLGLGAAAVIQQQALRDKADSSRAREQARDRALAEQQAADLACVKRWADAYTQRADRLNELATLRSDALDRLVVAAAGQHPAVTHARLLDYLAASARYRATTQKDPLPPSPTFACGLTPSRGPTPYRPGPTSPNRVPPVAPSSSATPPGRSHVAPSRSATRRTSPANRDTSTRAAGRVSPTRSTVAPRPGGGSSTHHHPGPPPSHQPRPPVLRLPIPPPVCLIVRRIAPVCE